jgi:predicted methyltransferase
MRGIERRLAALEQQHEEPGPFITVNVTYDVQNNWHIRTPEEAEEALAEAYRKAGPNGKVLIVQHVDNWKDPSGAAWDNRERD